MTKILIVDDSEVFLDEVRKTLESADYEVIQAHDGQDGIRVAKENDDVDVLISDFNMPEMNGLDMVREIKSLESFKNVPVLMLTTETSPDFKKIAQERGVVAWIVKPYVPEKLLLGVGKIVSKFCK